MTDKERILLTFIERLYFGREHALHMERKPAVGDLVYMNFMNVHNWSVGWLESFHSHDGYIIREIGSDRTCHCYNCTAVAIKTEPKWRWLEGKQYLFLQKVFKTFSRYDYYATRFGDISFHGRDVYLRVGRRWMPEVGKEIKLHMSMSMKKIHETIGPDGSQFDDSFHESEGD